jgi:ubiquinone/menaquinone biosynthesis C-methylase UbiE
MKLNLGCGKDIQEGYVNQDFVKFKGVDDVFDFNKFPWKYKDNTFEEVRIKDCIECVEDISIFMNEVWRIAKPNAKIFIEGVNFQSPINCQCIYYRYNLGFFSFDFLTPENKGNYYDCPAKFKIVNKEWIFSENKKLRWLSFIPNLFPKFYARFLYFLFPSNKLKFELKVIK